MTSNIQVSVCEVVTNSIEIPVVQNLESFKILLHSFENTESICDMKTEILHSIRAIFTLDSTRTGSSYLETLESFKVLFLQV